MPVMIDDIRVMLRAPKLKARSLVFQLNEELATSEKGLTALKRQEDKESWTYRCLCRCEFVVPCLYRLLGGGTTYKKEKPTNYCDYVLSCGKRKKKEKKKKRSERDEDTSSVESYSSSEDETHGLLSG
ncbi:hypothetical protein PsorP6_003916 [Peronosclerospora sorghi]|uniref:Uncharacterized protein n=1 Tax=Peronosclerospora sorghi TaxID=230839 RepID=A0ACC0VM87_9STRA|nr:hypothetical protein PsorP6_003916 [Peronosclerospora sorghi]